MIKTKTTQHSTEADLNKSNLDHANSSPSKMHRLKLSHNSILMSFLTSLVDWCTLRLPNQWADQPRGPSRHLAVYENRVFHLFRAYLPLRSQHCCPRTLYPLHFLSGFYRFCRILFYLTTLQISSDPTWGDFCLASVTRWLRWQLWSGESQSEVKSPTRNRNYHQYSWISIWSPPRLTSRGFLGTPLEQGKRAPFVWTYAVFSHCCHWRRCIGLLGKQLCHKLSLENHRCLVRNSAWIVLIWRPPKKPPSEKQERIIQNLHRMLSSQKSITQSQKLKCFA